MISIFFLSILGCAKFLNIPKPSSLDNPTMFWSCITGLSQACKFQHHHDVSLGCLLHSFSSKVLHVEALYIYVYIYKLYTLYIWYIYYTYNKCNTIYIHTYIIITSLFVNVTKYQLSDKTFKIQLYFNSYKFSMDWQRNEKCKNYTQLDQLKKIKKRRRVDSKEI